jgi:hypothetical protein
VPARTIACVSWAEFWNRLVGNSFKPGLLNVDKMAGVGKITLSSSYWRV